MQPSLREHALLLVRASNINNQFLTRSHSKIRPHDPRSPGMPRIFISRQRGSRHFNTPPSYPPTQPKARCLHVTNMSLNPLHVLRAQLVISLPELIGTYARMCLWLSWRQVTIAVAGGMTPMWGLITWLISCSSTNKMSLGHKYDYWLLWSRHSSCCWAWKWLWCSHLLYPVIFIVSLNLLLLGHKDRSLTSLTLAPPSRFS